MRALIIGAALAFAAGSALAASSHAVKGYVTKSGTYVAPSRATNPNRTKVDNYSSKPNLNPDSGKAGRIDPYKPAARRR